jgi:D-3-phosphoglycerate dehydrogenase
LLFSLSKLNTLIKISSTFAYVKKKLNIIFRYQKKKYKKNKMPKIVYLDTLPAQNGIDILESQSLIEVVKITSNGSYQEAFEELSNAHAYQVSAARDEVPEIFQVDEEFLSKTPNLLLVSSGGAGFDTIDVEACTKRGILVVNQTGGNAEAVAEHAVGMMISLLKKINESDRFLRQGWDGERTEFLGLNLFNKTIGVIGLGNTGGRVAEICIKGFNCKILSFDPYVPNERFNEIGAKKSKLDYLLSDSDIVTVHIPLNKETKNMINLEFFLKMKKGSYFVTTSRGSIHNENDLEKVINSGHLSGAGLDVWDKEPPDASHKLLKYKNVIATPHIAGVTIDSRRKMSEFVAKQLLTIMSGGNPQRPVNLSVLEEFKNKLKLINN